MFKYIKIGAGAIVASILTAVVYHAVFGTTIRPKTAVEFAKTSVMITRYDGRSGGTGVIVSSKRNESKILTNKHVCGVVKNGGLVRSDDKKAMVKYYQESNVHDLCLITVNTNFKVNTVLAPDAPEVYEDAIVSGHARLMPNLITYGHLGGKEFISVMIGMRPCTPEETLNPNLSLLCQLAGGIPVVKDYEAFVCSATIQPGSSGSAVFNRSGEIIGLVFAGSGEFGYSHLVPYEYIISFFEIELPKLTQIYPNPDSNSEMSETKVDWKKLCIHASNNETIEKVCDLLDRSLMGR